VTNGQTHTKVRAVCRAINHIDRAIMDRMAEELLKRNRVDANADNLVREQLRAAAEQLKIDLSTRSMGKSKVEELDFEFTLRRSEFEKLAEPLLKRTLEVCQEAMEVAGVSNKDLDQVLLVGGSTRIPSTTSLPARSSGAAAPENWMRSRSGSGGGAPSRGSGVGFGATTAISRYSGSGQLAIQRSSPTPPATSTASAAAVP